MKIGFIGFGEAAQAFAKTLGEDGGRSFSAYDILLGTEKETLVRGAAGRLGVELAESATEAISGADWIFSAVTAADSLDAARAVEHALGKGQVFIDINSVSAGRKRETAQLTRGGGAAYIDMAVMAPVHPRGHRTPVLVAGPDCDALTGRLGALGFDFGIAGPRIGDATSIKMVRSMFVKGLEAITVQALLAARAAGCLDAVHSSLSGSYPQFDWEAFPRYQIGRVTQHGVRRAAEMEESAVTMEELGLPAGKQLGRAIAALQGDIGRRGITIDETDGIEAMLDAILAELRR